tara:strand:- start:6720 stop:9305 length:2586 start_codon:yes stop_codon:yes gene_type:complete
MKKITLLLIILFCQFSLFAQVDYKQKATEKGANYFDIVKNTRAHFQNLKSKSSFALRSKKQEKQFERWAYFWKDRIGTDGKFPSATLGYYNAGILDAQGKIISVKKQKTQAESWVNIGPQVNPAPNGYANPPQLGRLNTFLRIKHPSDRNQDVLFVGAPSGGIWKSTNNGTTWSPKLDIVAGIGVTDIQTASTTTFSNYTTKPIYVSTGDSDGKNIKSIGVLKSTDGGETFVSTGLSNALSEQTEVSDLVVLDDNTLFVGKDNLIKKSIDGGTTWTNAYDVGGTDTMNGRVAVSGTNIMFTGNKGVYFSADSGTTWSVAIAPNGENRRAVTLGSDGSFYIQNQTGEIKKYDIGTKTFTVVGIKPGGYDSQGGYNQTLLFKDGMFLSGEVNGHTSIDNGASWNNSLNGYWGSSTDPGTYVHSDHHGMGTLDGQYEFWSTNDGGLNFTTFSSINDVKPTTVYKSNGVIVSQIYDVAITPTLSQGDYMLGLQDNDGFSKEMHNGTRQWISASAGDGVTVAINYNNPLIRYLGGFNGNFHKTGTGYTGKYNGETNGKIPGAGQLWPLEIHTTDPTILYAGGDDVYKVTDPNAGASIATAVTNAVKLNAAAGQINKISTHGNGIAVIGSVVSRLSKDSGTTWITLAEPTNAEFIDSVDFDQSNMSTVYCSVTGYTDGSKVFKSTDSGATWTNISTGLPNIVIHEVVLKQNQGVEVLFAGTEIGVYFKNGTDNWKKFGSGLPNVIVRDIDINYTEDKLVAATFGRGLWHINIANSTLGVEDTALNISPFSAYPSPVTDGKLNFKVDLANANFEYKIYNVLGGVVLQGKKDSNSGIINVSKLHTGIYMLKAYKNGKVFPTVKFLVSNK